MNKSATKAKAICVLIIEFFFITKDVIFLQGFYLLQVGIGRSFSLPSWIMQQKVTTRSGAPLRGSTGHLLSFDWVQEVIGARERVTNDH
jgi:hypothetical protein